MVEAILGQILKVLGTSKQWNCHWLFYSMNVAFIVFTVSCITPPGNEYFTDRAITKTYTTMVREYNCY